MSIVHNRETSEMAKATNFPLNPESVKSAANRLVERIANLQSCIVAFSGGVDSSVVAKAAFLALGEQAVAVTGIGNAVSETDLHWATEVASAIGVKHLRVNTSENNDPNYIKNDNKRCYYCKSHLYQGLRHWGNEHGFHSILSGTNLDDLSDYRPGLEAAKEYSVIAPLVEESIGKELVRAIAMYWELPVASRPASPCLASRIAYGEEVSIERLKRIEAAEAFLHQKGFYDVRVRLHGDELARIETHEVDFIRLMEPSERQSIQEEFRSLGFQYVTMDLGGRQKGSLNRVLKNQTDLHRPLPVLQ